MEKRMKNLTETAAQNKERIKDLDLKLKEKVILRSIVTLQFEEKVVLRNILKLNSKEKVGLIIVE